jgi:hypothetical protein
VRLLPASLTEPLWVQFSALLNDDDRPEFVAGPVTEPGGGQPRQLAFQQCPVHTGECVHFVDRLGQERTEPHQRLDVRPHRGHGQARGQPQP